MSRAGKFIPGGGNKAKRTTDPIRAPEPEPPAGTPEAKGKKRPFNRASLVKPVSKNQKLPIAVMSAFVCCMLVSVAFYFMVYLPQQRNLVAAQQAAAAAQAELDHEKELQKKKDEDAAALVSKTKATLQLDTNPTGAKAIIGDFSQTTPAKFDSITPGKITLTIQMDGYEDYHQEVTVTADKPTELPTIQLIQKAGNVSLSSPQSDVTYMLTGPNGYSHDGSIPEKLERLPIGDYSLVATQHDWKLPAKTFTVRDKDTTQKIIEFPYAKFTLTSTPPGATVRDGRTVIGQTPLNLTQVRPRDFHLTVDLAPYTLQHVDAHVPDFGNVSKAVTFATDKSFIASNGMPMVWIADGGFWAGKFEVRQKDFEAVAGYNPSQFRGANRPVESISWDSAMAFIDKLNRSEGKAGKLPEGFHYALPKESQWDLLNDGADIDLAATSRGATALTSTQDAGYSAPNKYGLYDTLGNVWEWCSDADEQGNHSLRGGCWLSSAEHFANASTRQAGAPKYTDQFTGFRLVLVPNQ